jgi:ABC-2 type transport system ATP-binding protein
MELSITVKNLKKSFQIYKKEEGLRGSLKALFKREYKNLEAVKNVSFDIRQGELVGFIGPNGAGKTTTLKMLSGLLYPTEGEVKVLGFTPNKRKPEFLKQISLIMGQKNQLWWDLPAIETFRLNKEIYEIPQDQYDEMLNDLIEMLDLGEAIHNQVRKLSLGQRMKCELIAALLHRPKVLFLDEPTIGLDVVVQKKVREFIADYNKKYNATIILTSHYMEDVKELCKRVIMINHGEIVFDGSTDELIKKYADYKLIIPVFNKSVERKELEQFGEIVEYIDQKATIKVARKDASKKAADLLSSFDIDDININEPRLEDIIRVAFSESK